MTNHDDDPYGSADKTTSYEAQGHRGARAGKARSAWAVGIAAVFLLGLGAWILLRPHTDSNPPAAASVDDGVTTGSNPENNPQ